MVVFATLFCIRKNHMKKSDKIVADRLHQLGDQGIPLVSRAVGDSTLKESFGLEVSCITSGSGSGAPRMNPRSLAHDITLIGDSIGKKHALKKYDQFVLNTSCFWGSTAQCSKNGKVTY